MTAPTEAGQERADAAAEPRPQQPADSVAAVPSGEQAEPEAPTDDDYEPL